LAGATGYLGRYIAAELLKQKYATKVVIRNTSKVFYDVNSFEIGIAEVTKPKTLIDIMKDIDAVISTVGITKQKDGLSYMDVDYQANVNLLNEAKKSGVSKFIYISALHGQKLTNLKILEAKEKFVGELQNSGLDYCIVRPNGFFSDMSEFQKMASKGKAELFGNGKFRMNPIHGADLAEVCVNAIETKDKTIEVGGPEVFTHNEIAELAFESLNKKPRIRYMPEWMRKTILWSARTFSSSKTYGPMEFFFTVLAMEMIAPKFGTHKLESYFNQVKADV